jgi:glycine/D-amino acid oxidase-like deaminating enzyme
MAQARLSPAAEAEPLMPIRNVPFWLDRVPKTRRPAFPKLRGDLDTSVVIVGGGLTGCACAWSFAAAGVKVVLLEAETIGGGTTAGSSGLVREDFDASFRETASAHGLRAARSLWQGMRRASLDFPAALRRLGVKCDLSPLDLLTLAPRDPETAKRLEREYQSRRSAGFDHSWLKPAAAAREIAIQSGGAIRTRGFSLDPYRACLGLASACRARGAAIYERSQVSRIRAGRNHVEIATATAKLRAEAVLVATSAPLADLRALRRHLRGLDRYAVLTEPMPAAVRRELGSRAAALADVDAPPHLLRWLKDDRALFSGVDQPVVADRARASALKQRTGQLMYELSVLYPAISGLQPQWAWDVTHYETVDRLPFVGLHRNFPRHLFAMGGFRHGVGFAWLAARILLRHYQGEAARGDDLFGFSRVL